MIRRVKMADDPFDKGESSAEGCLVVCESVEGNPKSPGKRKGKIKQNK
jgi:hypothetical protein